MIGSLSNLRLALSRQPDLPKTYMQDMLLEDAGKIVEILIKRKRYIYVCGDKRVSQGVNQALTTILTKRAGLEPKVAKEFILQNEGEPFCIGFMSLHSVKCSIIINVLNLWYIVIIDVGSLDL